MSGNVYVHPSADVEDGADIGEGTKVWRFACVRATAKVGRNCMIGQGVYIDDNAKVGNNVKIQNNVSVYYGVELEDYVFCGPSSCFTNVVTPRSKYPKDKSQFSKTLVREGATIGANATIVCGNTVGRHAFIGAGAVVTKDVPDYAIMVGAPARRLGWMCECGKRLRTGSTTTRDRGVADAMTHIDDDTNDDDLAMPSLELGIRLQCVCGRVFSESTAGLCEVAISECSLKRR